MNLMLAEATGVSYSDFQSIITALTSQISTANVVSVLASLVPVVIGFVFLWWGIRKGVKMLMSAFKKGRVSI